MIVYHVDRLGSLSPGQRIELEEYDSSDEWGSRMVDSLFLGKVSSHGRHMVAYNPPVDTGTAIIEYEFELVRRVLFADKPSRYQSVFALESLDCLLRWPELLQGGDYRVFEIECDDSQVARLDASWLLSPLLQDGSYSSTRSFEWAYSYWSGGENPNPRFELLVRLPIEVGRQIEPMVVPADKRL